MVVFTLHNVNLVQSVIFGPKTENATCEVLEHYKDKTYQCEVNITTSKPYERLMINLDRFRMSCKDTLYIYDSINGTVDSPIMLDYLNKTGEVIYSTENYLVLELTTTNVLAFDSPDFYLAYTPFKGSENGCNDSFVCRDEYKYCIPKEYMCNGHFDCSDGSDEGMQCRARESNTMYLITLIVLVCFASILLVSGFIWLCVHTRNKM